MLRLAPFEFVKPTSVEETVALLDRHRDKPGAVKLLAGGTDVMPNLKHGLYEPEVVIGLSDVAELRGIRVSEQGDLVLGAMTTLEDVESNELVLARAPGLAQAAHAVAGPTQRTMGTIGGNVCLDTRCVYINQTHFWRKALGYCLKKDGTLCHVVKGGRTCVAAASNDTATMLVALDARLTIGKVGGSRDVAIREFYKGDGIFNLKLAVDELLLKVTVPARVASTISASATGAATSGGAKAAVPAIKHWSGYAKLRPRATIDFPKLSVAVAFTTGADGAMTDATLVVSAIAATPRLISGVAEIARGRRPDDPGAIAAIGERARAVTHPLTNIDGDLEYRRAMVPVFVKRAFAAARAAEA
jgi:4-hydroxybenzoyl-CoA reductase subunit beta